MFWSRRLWLLTLVVACSEDSTGPPRPARVVIQQDSLRFNALQQTTQLSPQVQDSRGNTITGTAVTFVSSEPGVATVDGAGLVRAAANGTALVRASVAGTAGDSVLIRVQQVPAALAIAPAAFILAIGATRELSPEVVDSGGSPVPLASTGAVRFSAANAEIASVDPETGAVSGVAAGLAVIRAADTTNVTIRDSALVAVTGASSIVASAFAPATDGLVTVSPGGTFTLPIVLDLTRVSPNGDLGAAEFKIVFNAAALQLDSVRVTAGGVGNASAAGEYSIAYAALNPLANATMTLARLFGRVSASAPVGTQTISLSAPFAPVNTSLNAYSAPLLLPARVRIR